MAAGGFALTATHFFDKRLKKVSKKTLAPTFGPLARARGSFAPGFIRGASPTVCFAAPPLDVFGFAKRSLRSHPRINPSTQPAEGAGTSKALLELTLIVLSGGKPKRKQILVLVPMSIPADIVIVGSHRPVPNERDEQTRPRRGHRYKLSPGLY